MAYNVSISGFPYTLPSQSERNWSAQVNAFFVAIGQNLLQKSGGSFTLTNDVDFGTDKGALYAYLKSKTSINLPATGWLRMDQADRIIWRNILNNADVPLGLSAATGRFQTGQQTFFDALASTDVFTSYGRVPSVGETVQYQSFSGTGLTLGATYYVIAPITGDTFQISATNGGAAIDVLTDGSGVMIIMEDVLSTASTDIIRNKTARDFAYDSEVATITAAVLSPTSGRVIQRVTTSSATFSQINLPTTGKMYVMVNETASDIRILHNTGTATRTIFTPGATDFTWKTNSACTFVYDSGISAWVIAGGSSGSGLAPEARSASFTAVAGKHYLVNSSGGAIAVTLPVGTTEAAIKFSDANETWDTFNVTITPASGQTIDMLAVNETLVCDVRRSWVELSWNGARWVLGSLSSTTVGEASASASGIVNTGTQSFAGNKTFVGTLAPTGGIVGKTDGAAVAAGFIGEIYTQTWVSIQITTSGVNLCTLSGVQIGNYLVFVEADVGFSAATRIPMPPSGWTGGTATIVWPAQTAAGEWVRALESLTAVYNLATTCRVTAAGTLIVSASSIGGNTTSSCRGRITLVRIA